MDWISVAVSAGAGALAVLFSLGVLRLLGRPAGSRGAVVLHAAVFAAALAFGRHVVEPGIQAWRVESALLEMPVYRALQQHEPQAYQRIRAAIAQGIEARWPQQQIWAATRPVVSEVTARLLPQAPDELLTRFAHHLVDALTRLHATGGTECFSYVNPAPGVAVDFGALLGAEFTSRELALIADVVVATAAALQPPVDRQAAAQDLEAVVARLLAIHGPEAVATLENPQVPGLDRRRYCEVIAGLYREATALPAPRGARLLRFLMQT